MLIIGEGILDWNWIPAFAIVKGNFIQIHGAYTGVSTSNIALISGENEGFAIGTEKRHILNKINIACALEGCQHIFFNIVTVNFS